MSDVGQIIEDTAAALGCRPDNEAILFAIERLRGKLDALHREIGAWEMDGPNGPTTVAEFIDA